MMRLNLTLPQGEGEAPADYAARLSFRNGRDHASEFCSDFGMSLREIADGNRWQIEQLAEIASADFGQLYGEAFIRSGKRYVHKGQDLTAFTLVRDRVRVCPHCLVDDLRQDAVRREAQMYRRSKWMVVPIRTCAVHNVELIDIGMGSDVTSCFDASAAMALAMGQLPQMKDAARTRQPTAFEKYAGNRIEGTGEIDTSTLLNALPLYAAMRVCQVLGAVAVHGPTVKLESLHDHALWECEAAGFEVANGGESSICRVFEGCWEAVSRSRGEWGTRGIYGRIYEWLAHETDDPAYEPIREILWRHIVGTTPTAPGTEILGRKLDQRRVYSVHSASKAYGLHPKRLRRLLVEAGVISKTATEGLSNGHVIATAKKVEPVLAEISTALSLNEVRDYANVPRPHERILYEAGFIKPVIAGGTKELKNHAFRRKDIDDFLARILIDASEEFFGKPGFYDIRSAAKRNCCRAEQIIQLLLDRKLKRVGRNPQVGGYLSVLVDVEELRPLVIGEDHGGINLRTATCRIRTSDRVMSALVANHFIETERVKNPVTKQIQTIIRPTELDRFLREFVGLHVLAEERYEHFRKTKAEMEARKIEPAFDPKLVMATFYRREDLQT